MHYLYTPGYILCHNSKGNDYFKWSWNSDISCMGPSNPVVDIKKFDIILPETLIYVDGEIMDDDELFFRAIQVNIEKNIFDKL